MGHLTLISEDVLTTLQHSSRDLHTVISKFTPQPEWNEYVNGRYQETKNKDTSLLGGGKPALSLTRPGSAASWKVDEQDIAAHSPGTSLSAGGLNAVGAVKEIASKVAESQKEFRKSAAERRETSTHFDLGAGDEGDPSSSSAGPSRVDVFSSPRTNNLFSSSRLFFRRSSSPTILGPLLTTTIPMKTTGAVGWQHQDLDLLQPHTTRKICSRKVDFPYAVFVITSALSLTKPYHRTHFLQEGVR